MFATASIRARATVPMMFIILYIVVSSAVPWRLFGGDDPPSQTVVGRPGPFDSTAAINALESHNPRPRFPFPAGTVQFDKNFDWSENRRVFKAIDTLATHADDALLELVSHLDDDRYCTTLAPPDSLGPMNESVGDVCRMIISKWLQAPYARDLSASPSKLAYDWLLDGGVPHSRDRMKAWCEQRKGKRLYELQIETCKWVVSNVGGGTVPKLREEEAKSIAAAVQAKIDLLETTKKPIRFGGFNFQGPWPPSLMNKGVNKGASHRIWKIYVACTCLHFLNWL